MPKLFQTGLDKLQGHMIMIKIKALQRCNIWP